MSNNTLRKNDKIKALCFFFLLIGGLSACTTSSKQEQQQGEQKRVEQENIWKQFAGNTYATIIETDNYELNVGFVFDNSGNGSFALGKVGDDIDEADIYKVTSDGAYLYLHVAGLDSPAIVEIRGNNLYTRTGERYIIIP